MTPQQSNLFDQHGGGTGQQARGNTRPAPPHKSQPRRTALRPVGSPFGKPDRRGQYWYQKFHKEVEEAPEAVRKVLLHCILEWPYQNTDTLMRLLNKYHRAQIREQDNYVEALGR